MQNDPLGCPELVSVSSMPTLSAGPGGFSTSVAVRSGPLVSRQKRTKPLNNCASVLLSHEETSAGVMWSLSGALLPNPKSQIPVISPVTLLNTSTIHGLNGGTKALRPSPKSRASGGIDGCRLSGRRAEIG